MSLILLNPGPVTLSERVRSALLGPDLCHREPEFAELQTSIRDKLLAVYGLDPHTWTAALMTGSGTAAVESMISSLVPQNGKLLSIENGVYGERISKIAEHYGIPLSVANFDWEAAIDYAQIDRQLEQDPHITHVAAIHHETTTGRLNDLAPLAELCSRRGVKILLDAVSSFGAETIDFKNWPIAGCAATANKCLHGVPGTSFNIVARSDLVSAHARNVYLDLKTYVDAQDNNGTPFTQSVQTFYALDEALSEFFDLGGVAQRLATYQDRMTQIRQHLRSLNIKPLLPDEDCSAVLHAYELPATCTYQDLHDGLKNHGFIIYAGQGSFAKRLFRVSMMGTMTDEDIDRLKQAFSASLPA